MGEDSVPGLAGVAGGGGETAGPVFPPNISLLPQSPAPGLGQAAGQEAGQEPQPRRGRHRPQPGPARGDGLRYLGVEGQTSLQPPLVENIICF